MTRLEQAMVQLKLARSYTLALLEDIPEQDWHLMPIAGVTHITWQVGHLAIAQYNLTLARIRGSMPGDRELFPSDNFAELFGRTSTPLDDPSRYPTPAELRATLNKVSTQANSDLANLTDDELDQATEVAKPHPIVTTKLSSLLWCAHHEFCHAGQIGLIRRMLGAKPRW